MAVNVINYRLQDDESDVKRQAVPIYVPTGFTLAQYQSFSNTFAPLLDAVTESAIAEIELTVALTKTGLGLKTTPTAGALNERGGIIGMSNAGQWGDSVRIPAILHTIMSGNEFSLSDTDIAALISGLLLGDTTVIPRTRDGFTWTAGLYGKKSFRRK